MDRGRLARAGIADPVSLHAAARLADVFPVQVKRWVRRRMVACVKVGRFSYCSRAEVLRCAKRYRALEARMERDLSAGRLVRAADAAKRLGINKWVLLHAIKAGLLRPIRIELLHATLLRVSDVDRIKAELLAPRHRRGLPPGLLDTAQAARLLGVAGRHRVRELVTQGRLRVAARGTGWPSAYGFEKSEVRRLRREMAE